MEAVLGGVERVISLFRTVVEGKINRLLMKPLNHRLVKTADQRLRGLSDLIGGLLKLVYRTS